MKGFFTHNNSIKNMSFKHAISYQMNMGTRILEIENV